MKFGPVSTAEAVGCLLAHALVLPERRLKKGHHLTADDVEAITKAGIDEVTVARLETDDVHENSAAERIARELVGASFSVADPFTGRVNIYAQQTGILTVNKQTVDAVNRIDPAITLATLDDGSFVQKGRMVATVKIIPFAVAEHHVAAATSLLGEKSALSFAVATPAAVGLVATRLPSLKPSVMDKTARVLLDRLNETESALIDEIRVPHEAEAVAEALQKLHGKCDMLIIFGASAITDDADILPSAVCLAGGEVARFGIPVDPGNLLMIGKLNGKPVIGAPGCARSPAENGFDWVLQRLICGLPVDEDYLTGLGVGGLLMEISQRPQPRESEASTT